MGEAPAGVAVVDGVGDEVHRRVGLGEPRLAVEVDVEPARRVPGQELQLGEVQVGDVPGRRVLGLRLRVPGELLDALGRVPRRDRRLQDLGRHLEHVLVGDVLHPQRRRHRVPEGGVDPRKPNSVVRIVRVPD